MARDLRKAGGTKNSASRAVPAKENPAPTATATATSSRPGRSVWSIITDNNVRRALYLVLLAATYAPLSQLILSPVFGSIPASVYHKYGILASAMLAFLIKGYVPTLVENLFAAFVFWIPVMHWGLFYYSTRLGNPLGPLVIECLTTYPLITMSMHLAAKQYDELDLGLQSQSLAEAAPSMFNYLLFIISSRLMKDMVPKWMGMNFFFTRVGLQLILATTYASVLPQSLIWPAVPAIVFNTVANPHGPLGRNLEVLQNTLALYNYTLIERQESISGYLSVLEDNDKKFRVMRCDHSLLGGNWIPPANSKSKGQVPDPVFAVFTMLEAVRLVDRGPKKAHAPETALNIGLGVGTAPAALMAHGVNVTIIELDQHVHLFAVNHFGLSQRHWAYIGDAAAIVASRKEEDRDKYDYIIHDVFTGGAEPVHLFTFEFLSGLKQMLKDDGAITINYAGDLAMPSTSLIYRTITEVFPSCRVFREDEQIAEQNSISVEGAGDFTNLVFFCTKAAKAVQFRKATEADFLGSASRKAYMVPKYEVPQSKFEVQGELLTRSNTKVLEKMHVQSAIGHWKLMRKVMPDAVWETW